MIHRLTRLIIAVACLALAVGLWPTTVHADTGSNWTGQYFANAALQGVPVFTRIDPALVFNWGGHNPGPGIGSQFWSARWTSVQYLNAGTYQFTATADDGVRVFIDGQNILDAWHDQAATTYYVNVNVSAGNHAIEVNYYQASGDSELILFWDFVETVSTAWTAQYYNNPFLGGAPQVIRAENSINYDWGLGSPDPAIAPNNFSARWTATLPFSAGTYRFTLTGDSGVRLFIDDLTIINQWQPPRPLTTYSIDFAMNGGLHTLRIEYYHLVNQALIRFDYQLAVGPPPYPRPQSSQWYGEYYGNPGLQGSPLFVRYDGESGINFDWSAASPAPGFPHDNYSVRWSRQVCIPGRPYIFYLTVDDGARFYIDTTLIIDSWRVQNRTTIRQPVDLTVGCHNMRLEYFQATGNAIINLTWNPPDGQNPPQYLGGSPPPGNPTGVFAQVQYASSLNVRNGPSIAYDVLEQVHFSDTLSLVARNADTSWVQVITPDNTNGWVNASYIVDTQGSRDTLPIQGIVYPPNPGTPTNVRGKLTSDLRVRSGPGTGYEQIDTFAFGSIVEIIGRTSDNSWLQVRYGDQTGWIYGPYVLIVSGFLSNVPVTG